MKKHKRYRNQIKNDKQKEYDEMESSQADMADFRRPAYAVKRAIRMQGEQIREDPAEYIARKYKIGGDAVDKGDTTELPEQERRDRGAGLDAKKPVAG